MQGLHVVLLLASQGGVRYDRGAVISRSASYASHMDQQIAIADSVATISCALSFEFNLSTYTARTAQSKLARFLLALLEEITA
jgi:hypothetical protein